MSGVRPTKTGGGGAAYDICRAGSADAVDEKPADEAKPATLPTGPLFFAFIRRGETRAFIQLSFADCDMGSAGLTARSSDHASVDCDMGIAIDVTVNVQRTSRGHLMF